MVDQAKPTPDTATSQKNDMPKHQSTFTPRGEPVITGINRVSLWSLYIKEVRRFLKVQTQTIWAPAVTTLLFLVIFSVALGRGGREVLGVSFSSFVAPGLIMMGMMQNAFANSSFSLLSGKIQGTITAMTRALLVGFTVAAAMFLYPGVTLNIAHGWAIIWFGLMGAMMLSLLGLITSIWSEKFDHNAAISNFVVAPLSLLSGTFYVLDNLAPAFQTISRANPFYVVVAALGLLALNAVLAVIAYRLLKSGWKIKN